MCPSGNCQGGHHFYSLRTGRRLNRRQWIPMPMPDDVIDRVLEMAGDVPEGIHFEYGNMAEEFQQEDDEEIDKDDELSHDDDDYHDVGDLSANGDDKLSDGYIDEVEPDEILMWENVFGEEAQEWNPELDRPDMDNSNCTEENNDEDNASTSDENGLDVMEDNLSVDEDNNNSDEVSEYLPPTNSSVTNNCRFAEEPAEVIADSTDRRGMYRRRLRPNRGASYEHLQQRGQLKKSTRDAVRKVQEPPRHNELGDDFHSTVLTQYHANKGLKLYGDAGKNAVLKEMKQLDNMDSIEPVLPNDISIEDKDGVLEYLMFLKEKRCGTIKGRGCADGRPQRLYTGKDESSSKTVTIESVMLTSMIDALEERDTATVNIPGAFLQTEMDELVYMVLRGKLVDALLQYNYSKYHKFVVYEKGVKVMYVKLKKALYGTLRASLLFWRNLTAALKRWGFKLNPYDDCVANRIINGSQATIIWHVDDLKISHKDPKVVTRIINKLKKKYGKVNPLTVTRGKLHDYLGMTLDFRKERKVKVTMYKYIQDMLRELPDDMKGLAVTPAADHLFKINPSPKFLDKARSEMFHHLVAKCLFLCKRARPDIHPTVAFLTTRVQKSDEDDWRKLARLMKYLRKTMYMPLTLEVDDIQIIKWFVDASYGTHGDFRSHTGGCLMLGEGTPVSISRKQKLNSKSSTEAEVIGVDDVLGHIIWTRNFMLCQGHDIKDNIVYQDNESAMLLEKNGRASSTKRTKHMNIRYFLVKDRISKKEMSVQYCNTKEMLGDYFSKPVQGRQFYKFRKRIMNLCSEETDYAIKPIDFPHTKESMV